ncbi:hypothetical protein, partial [Aliamphritea spongicola]|uniref:hypothetical protein n=1 Tax=Aliamphritea spongicola TaxID=707589 RepID=UPI00196B6F23
VEGRTARRTGDGHIGHFSDVRAGGRGVAVRQRHSDRFTRRHRVAQADGVVGGGFTFDHIARPGQGDDDGVFCTRWVVTAGLVRDG